MWQHNSCPRRESPTEVLYPQNGPTAGSWSLQCTPKELGLPRDRVGSLVIASASIPRELKWASYFKENLGTPFGNVIKSLIIQQPKAAHTDSRIATVSSEFLSRYAYFFEVFQAATRFFSMPPVLGRRFLPTVTLPRLVSNWLSVVLLQKPG